MQLFNKVVADKIAGRTLFWLSVFSAALLFAIFYGLVYKSVPILESHSLKDLLFSSNWKPFKGDFGFLPFILSTILVTVFSIIIAVPVCILTAVYLSEYASKRIKRIVIPFIDILAGIPSVIFGIWGVVMVVPFIRDDLAPFFGAKSSGYCILAGGLVLSIMSFPVIINILYEVLKTVPADLRDASLSLGANKWETIKKVVLKKARPGLIAAIVLGFSRALGETIAVLMVVGNVPKIPKSIFDSGYPLPALIANNYGEMMSIPLYDSALMFAALLLFVVIAVFNIISRTILNRIERQMV